MLQRQKLWVPMMKHNPMFAQGLERFLHKNPMSTYVASTLGLRPDNVFVALEPDARYPEKSVARFMAVPFKVTSAACGDYLAASVTPSSLSSSGASTSVGGSMRRRPLSHGFATNASDSLNSLHVMERLLPTLSIHVSICLQLQQLQQLYEGDELIIVSAIEKMGKRIAYCKTDVYLDQFEPPKEVAKAERSMENVDDLIQVLAGYRKALTGSHVKNILAKTKEEPTVASTTASASS